MKRLYFIAALAIMTFSISCSQTNTGEQTVDIDAQGPVLTFEVTEHDFGTIEKGGNGTFNFVFKNEGTTPLILNEVRSSCGCTIPKWPREPLPAGEESVIEVRYDTKRMGNFSKSITVKSNASDTPIVLRIKGTVIIPNEEAASAK